jgi:hypothetical protein
LVVTGATGIEIGGGIDFLGSGSVWAAGEGGAVRIGGGPFAGRRLPRHLRGAVCIVYRSPFESPRRGGRQKASLTDHITRGTLTSMMKPCVNVYLFAVRSHRP